jgi:hypothetical protein
MVPIFAAPIELRMSNFTMQGNCLHLDFILFAHLKLELTDFQPEALVLLTFGRAVSYTSRNTSSNFVPV